MRRLAFGTCFLLLLSCGGTPTLTPFAGTFAGTETGTQAGTPFSQTIVFTLTQSGTAVTGNGSNNTGTSYGTISGTANGNSISNFSFVQNSATGCPGTLTGSVTISGNALTGNASGTLDTCGAVSAAFVATKQ